MQTVMTYRFENVEEALFYTISDSLQKVKRNHPNLQQSLQDVVRVRLRSSNLRWRL